MEHGEHDDALTPTATTPGIETEPTRPSADEGLAGHRVRPPFPGRYALVLLLASVVASVLVVPYSFALISQDKRHSIPRESLPQVMVTEVAIETALAALAILAGLKLGIVGELGLGWPPLDGWDIEPAEERRRRLRAAIGWALALGVVSTLLILALSRAMHGQLNDGAEIKLPSWPVSLIASIGAGIREEVWLRLGVMTFFVWLGARLTGRRSPGPWLTAGANGIACLLFAAMHLPQAALLLGLTPAIVAFVMIANGVPGLLFGWLFARKGLVAAMISHALADILLKVVVPLLWP